VHDYRMPDAVRERVLRRQGRIPANETLEAARTALVVIDMQNYFCAPGFPAEVPLSRGIVPNINRLGRALRAAGGKVVWVQTTAAGALDKWANHHAYMLSPERREKRLKELAETAEGFKLFPALEALPADPRVKKIHYSAFLARSSNLDEVLKGLGIDTVLIAGTATNVCCESSARDAMMLDYKVVMVSDCNAAGNDAAHATSLDNFALYFGDVMSTDDAVARIVPVGVPAAAAGR
jgi:ureidoacrylate peracid hydrolase